MNEESDESLRRFIMYELPVYIKTFEWCFSGIWVTSLFNNFFSLANATMVRLPGMEGKGRKGRGRKADTIPPPPLLNSFRRP